jgi:hypothetical protein
VSAETPLGSQLRLPDKPLAQQLPDCCLAFGRDIAHWKNLKSATGYQNEQTFRFDGACDL